MKLDEKIQVDIDTTKKAVQERIQEYRDSLTGRTNSITLLEIRSLRQEILYKFMQIKNSLPYKIYEDITLDNDTSMNGITERLHRIQNEIVSLKLEREIIDKRCSTLKDRIEEIEKR